MASSPKSQTSPLLPPTSKDHLSNTPNRLTQGAINVLSITRLVAGTACVIAPGFTTGLFRIPVSGQALILPRIFGVREGVLAELLWTAEGTQSDKWELKRALWAGVAADTLDVASCAFGLATGALSRPAAGLFGGGATIFLALGAIGLRGV
ncbi:uncharacterized protein BDZ99DRAFT_207134 [Mytilinidion resinicola]|uniref:Uncharacterized protein n=1 Tax=Mytilinidion resinicola TaxID=574789 RepID=A0A6A6Y0S6_9PEZI|nr:uncharacterized protein BDZ99DRAFT_207134 [Mytilinidion resinicola]KAF2802249.1 hypothetical protein BDZ99DRAFT_207134 [Mytilinidion resinicola]